MKKNSPHNEKEFEKEYKAHLKHKEALKRSKEAQRLYSAHKRAQTIAKKKMK